MHCVPPLLSCLLVELLQCRQYLLLNHHCLLNFRLQRQNLDSRVILQQVQQNLQLLRLVQL